jgi:hypothetical protein
LIPAAETVKWSGNAARKGGDAAAQAGGRQCIRGKFKAEGVVLGGRGRGKESAEGRGRRMKFGRVLRRMAGPGGFVGLIETGVPGAVGREMRMFAPVAQHRVCFKSHVRMN